MPTTKASIRKLMQAERSALSPSCIHSHSKLICQRLSKFFEVKRATKIALYFPHKGEVDVMPLTNLLGPQIQFLLPVVLKNKLLAFHPYKKTDALKANQYGILEPETLEGPPPLSEIDLFILPVLAFDTSCNRIGTGAGYYDKTLATLKKAAKNKPYLIAAAFDFQLVDSIIADTWDIPLNCVVTEKNIYFSTKA